MDLVAGIIGETLLSLMIEIIIYIYIKNHSQSDAEMDFWFDIFTQTEVKSEFSTNLYVITDKIYEDKLGWLSDSLTKAIDVLLW